MQRLSVRRDAPSRPPPPPLISRRRDRRGAATRVVLALACVAGCDGTPDVRGPAIVSSSPAHGETGVDPAALASVVVAFDRGLDPASGRVVLELDGAERELAHGWDDPAVLRVPVSGWLTYRTDYRVRLEGFTDVAGEPLEVEHSLPGGALAFSTAASGDAVAPRLVAADPMPGAVDVYPAPVTGGAAPRVRIVLRFDEPMDPLRGQVEWGPAGAPRQPRVGTWSSDRRELVVEIQGTPLSGQRPLADRILYELDLRALRDLSGNRVDGDVLVEGGVLRFTSGVHDPLLEHSCGHVYFGPYATATASAEPTPNAARTDISHTQYTVHLPPDPDAPGLRRGYTRLRSAAASTWHLFLDGAYPLALEAAGGEVIPLDVVPAPAACVGITHRATFTLAELDERWLRIGPQAAESLELFVEQVTECARARPGWPRSSRSRRPAAPPRTTPTPSCSRPRRPPPGRSWWMPPRSRRAGCCTSARRSTVGPGCW
ncbi:MAG: Ig-like domain-containing protein [Kofleriaceae bacterium]